jgi:hypothetical protein
LQSEVESLRSGGVPLESLDRSDGGNPSALMQKREIVRLTEELLRSDSGKSMPDNFTLKGSTYKFNSRPLFYLLSKSTGRGPTS